MFINVYSSLFNHVSSTLWPLNWHIWWFIAGRIHIHVIDAETRFNLVGYEMTVMFAWVIVGIIVFTKITALRRR